MYKKKTNGKECIPTFKPQIATYRAVTNKDKHGQINVPAIECQGLILNETHLDLQFDVLPIELFRLEISHDDRYKWRPASLTNGPATGCREPGSYQRLSDLQSTALLIDPFQPDISHSSSFSLSSSLPLHLFPSLSSSLSLHLFPSISLLLYHPHPFPSIPPSLSLLLYHPSPISFILSLSLSHSVSLCLYLSVCVCLSVTLFLSLSVSVCLSLS
ncbi:hypothetical protein Ahia01_001355800, partial [Argonauta hians]